MYSPVRFPYESSPYGTPTIRKVTRSAANLLDAEDMTAQDDKAGGAQEQAARQTHHTAVRDEQRNGEAPGGDDEIETQHARARPMTAPDTGEGVELVRVPRSDGTGRWKWAHEF